MELAGGVRTVPERLTLDPATSTACRQNDLFEKPSDDFGNDDGDDGNDFAT